MNSEIDLSRALYTSTDIYNKVMAQANCTQDEFNEIMNFHNSQDEIEFDRELNNRKRRVNVGLRTKEISADQLSNDFESVNNWLFLLKNQSQFLHDTEQIDKSIKDPDASVSTGETVENNALNLYSFQTSLVRQLRKIIETKESPTTARLVELYANASNNLKLREEVHFRLSRNLDEANRKLIESSTENEILTDTINDLDNKLKTYKDQKSYEEIQKAKKYNIIQEEYQKNKKELLKQIDQAESEISGYKIKDKTEVKLLIQLRHNEEDASKLIIAYQDKIIQMESDIKSNEASYKQLLLTLEKELKSRRTGQVASEKRQTSDIKKKMTTNSSKELTTFKKSSTSNNKQSEKDLKKFDGTDEKGVENAIQYLDNFKETTINQTKEIFDKEIKELQQIVEDEQTNIQLECSQIYNEIVSEVMKARDMEVSNKYRLKGLLNDREIELKSVTQQLEIYEGILSDMTKEYKTTKKANKEKKQQLTGAEKQKWENRKLIKASIKSIDNFIDKANFIINLFKKKLKERMDKSISTEYPFETGSKSDTKKRSLKEKVKRSNSMLFGKEKDEKLGIDPFVRIKNYKYERDDLKMSVRFSPSFVPKQPSNVTFQAGINQPKGARRMSKISPSSSSVVNRPPANRRMSTFVGSRAKLAQNNPELQSKIKKQQSIDLETFHEMKINKQQSLDFKSMKLNMNNNNGDTFPTMKRNSNTANESFPTMMQNTNNNDSFPSMKPNMNSNSGDSFPSMRPNINNNGGESFPTMRPNTSSNESDSFPSMKTNINNSGNDSFPTMRPNTSSNESDSFPTMRPNTSSNESDSFPTMRPNTSSNESDSFPSMRPNMNSNGVESFPTMKPNSSNDNESFPSMMPNSRNSGESFPTMKPPTTTNNDNDSFPSMKSNTNNDNAESFPTMKQTPINNKESFPTMKPNTNINNTESFPKISGSQSVNDDSEDKIAFLNFAEKVDVLTRDLNNDIENENQHQENTQNLNEINDNPTQNKFTPSNIETNIITPPVSKTNENAANQNKISPSNSKTNDSLTKEKISGSNSKTANDSSKQNKVISPNNNEDNSLTKEKISPSSIHSKELQKEETIRSSNSNVLIPLKKGEKSEKDGTHQSSHDKNENEINYADSSVTEKEKANENENTNENIITSLIIQEKMSNDNYNKEKTNTQKKISASNSKESDSLDKEQIISPTTRNTQDSSKQDKISDSNSQSNNSPNNETIISSNSQLNDSSNQIKINSSNDNTSSSSKTDNFGNKEKITPSNSKTDANSSNQEKNNPSKSNINDSLYNEKITPSNSKTDKNTSNQSNNNNNNVNSSDNKIDDSLTNEKITSLNSKTDNNSSNQTPNFTSNRENEIQSTQNNEQTPNPIESTETNNNDKYNESIQPEISLHTETDDKNHHIQIHQPPPNESTNKSNSEENKSETPNDKQITSPLLLSHIELIITTKDEQPTTEPTIENEQHSEPITTSNKQTISSLQTESNTLNNEQTKTTTQIQLESQTTNDKKQQTEQKLETLTELVTKNDEQQTTEPTIEKATENEQQTEIFDVEQSTEKTDSNIQKQHSKQSITPYSSTSSNFQHEERGIQPDLPLNDEDIKLVRAPMILKGKNTRHRVTITNKNQPQPPQSTTNDAEEKEKEPTKNLPNQNNPYSLISPPLEEEDDNKTRTNKSHKEKVSNKIDTRSIMPTFDIRVFKSVGGRFVNTNLCYDPEEDFVDIKTGKLCHKYRHWNGTSATFDPKLDFYDDSGILHHIYKVNLKEIQKKKAKKNDKKDDEPTNTNTNNENVPPVPIKTIENKKPRRKSTNTNDDRSSRKLKRIDDQILPHHYLMPVPNSLGISPLNYRLRRSNSPPQRLLYYSQNKSNTNSIENNESLHVTPISDQLVDSTRSQERFSSKSLRVVANDDQSPKSARSFKLKKKNKENDDDTFDDIMEPLLPPLSHREEVKQKEQPVTITSAEVPLPRVPKAAQIISENESLSITPRRLNIQARMPNTDSSNDNPSPRRNRPIRELNLLRGSIDLSSRKNGRIVDVKTLSPRMKKNNQVSNSQPNMISNENNENSK